MIIIDKPYISEELKQYLDNARIPVLQNSIAQSENVGHNFTLYTDDVFAALYNDMSRLYTLSENSLEWIKKHIPNKYLHNCIELMKDKYAFREKIQPLYPNFSLKKFFSMN